MGPVATDVVLFCAESAAVEHDPHAPAVAQLARREPQQTPLRGNHHLQAAVESAALWASEHFHEWRCISNAGQRVDPISAPGKAALREALVAAGA